MSVYDDHHNPGRRDEYPGGRRDSDQPGQAGVVHLHFHSITIQSGAFQKGAFQKGSVTIYAMSSEDYKRLGSNNDGDSPLD